MRVEKIRGAEEALHAFLSGWKDYVLNSILTSLRWAPGSRTNFISKESNDIISYPWFFYFKDEAVLLATDKDELQFGSSIDEVVRKSQEIVKDDYNPVFEIREDFAGEWLKDTGSWTGILDEIDPKVWRLIRDRSLENVWEFYDSGWLYRGQQKLWIQLLWQWLVGHGG